MSYILTRKYQIRPGVQEMPKFVPGNRIITTPGEASIVLWNTLTSLNYDCRDCRANGPAFMIAVLFLKISGYWVYVLFDSGELGWVSPVNMFKNVMS